jgi:hypothetical protein
MTSNKGEYRIRVIKTGESEVPAPEVYWMSSWDKWEKLSFHMLLAYNEDTNFLINTGLPDDLMLRNAEMRKFAGERCIFKQFDAISELEKIGNVYKEINEKLKPAYGDLEIFKIFERVYLEHFTIVEEKIIIKSTDELTSSCIQSPDDIEATYRKKGGKQFYGQAINITETCNPENPINLITDISVHANNIDDSKELNARIDVIKQKSPELNELHFDGGYGSKDNDEKFDEHSITPVQTAIRGREFGGVEIKIIEISEDKYLVSYPTQTVESEFVRKRFKAEFDLDICTGCRFASQCKLQQFKKARIYYFTQEEKLKQLRIKSIKSLPKERRSLRTNVEATVSEFARKMNNRKLKVRGSFKAELFAFAVGISVNFGRVYRYIISQIPEPELPTG